MNKSQAKTGRKGDPRMHRAVAARLENPELSLFEALRMGGFDYAADEDASIMDSEKVTLGQRKNQLSRRLRLARKQQDEGMSGGGSVGGGGGGGLDHHNHNHASAMLDDSLVSGLGGGGGLGGMTGLGGGGGGTNHSAAAAAAASLNAKMKLQLQQHQNAAHGAMSSEAQRQLEKLMQHSQQAKLGNGVKRTAQFAELGPDAEMHPNEEETGLMEDKQQNARRMAKFHPQYQPLFIPRAASLRNSFPAGSSQLSSQLSSTPQLGPLTAPLTPLAPPPSTVFASAAAGSSNSSLFPTSSGSSLLGQTQSALAQRRTAGITSHASGVAIASLSATAQSIGLSLEQLAVALSSSSNLVKVLSNNSGSEQQQELALRLFRNESRALYQRCMLLAGFRPEDAEEKSQNHLQFAFSAWQMEGKRLQELMGSDDMTGRGPYNNNNTSSTTQSRLSAGRSTTAPTSSGLNSNSLSGMLGINGPMSNATSERIAQQQLHQQQEGMQRQQQQQQEQQFKQEHHQHAQHEHQASNDHHNGHSHSANDHRNGHHLDGRNHGGHGHGPSGGHDHAHEHGHSHEHQYDGRHVHQLEGKCGHKAIIHQPKDGSAHIDFVVGDKVECYHGIQPLGNNSVSIWPSKYKCEDLSCPPPCDDEACEIQPVDLDIHGRAPKILDLSDIDLRGAEWNSDLNGLMGGTLLGLFKLGESDKDSDETSPQGNSNGNDGYSIQV